MSQLFLEKQAVIPVKCVLVTLVTPQHVLTTVGLHAYRYGTATVRLETLNISTYIGLILALELQAEIVGLEKLQMLDYLRKQIFSV